MFIFISTISMSCHVWIVGSQLITIVLSMISIINFLICQIIHIWFRKFNYNTIVYLIRSWLSSLRMRSIRLNYFILRHECLFCIESSFHNFIRQNLIRFRSFSSFYVIIHFIIETTQVTLLLFSAPESLFVRLQNKLTIVIRETLSIYPLGSLLNHFRVLFMVLMTFNMITEINNWFDTYQIIGESYIFSIDFLQHLPSERSV